MLVVRRTAEIGELPCCGLFSLSLYDDAFLSLDVKSDFEWALAHVPFINTSTDGVLFAVAAFSRWYLWTRFTRGSNVESVNELQVVGATSQ